MCSFMSVFTVDGTENRMRWDRHSAGFMEVWYATLNHAPSGGGVWLRYTLTAPAEGPPYCELWGFFFDPEGKRSFAGKNRFGIDALGSANGRDDGALVRIGDAWLSETHLEGSVSGSEGVLAWSLDLEPASRTFQHIPSAFRTRSERRLSTVCSPNLSVPFRGTVTLNDEVLSFAGERGCQSHRWGRKHAGAWAWAHCEAFEDSSEEVVFEGVVAKPEIGPVSVPSLTMLYLSLDGEDIAFNEPRWMLSARSRYEMPTWAFAANTDSWKIAGAGRARLERMFQVEYTDPDGSNRYCANSEIADLAIEIYARDGGSWRHRASLTSVGGAHLEFGRRRPFVELPVVF